MSDERPQRLPRRDIWLLPLIAAATLVVLLGCGEAAARWFWTERVELSACSLQNPVMGERFRPNCTEMTKAAEGPWVANHFNECGYRTEEACGDLQPGQRRVVVMGSSTARGALVSYEETFAARAGAALTQLCGGLVDFQNLATESNDLGKVSQRIPEALRLKPSAIILVLGSYDIVHPNPDPPALPSGNTRRLSNLREISEFPHKVSELLRHNSRLYRIAQLYLFRNPELKIVGFLYNGSDVSDFVHRPLNATWQTRLSNLSKMLESITSQTEPSGVSLLLVYIGQRAEAALEIPKYSRPDVDPRALPDALRQIARKDGTVFIDATPALASAADFNSLYYIENGHLSGKGHAVVARLLIEDLLRQPAFSEDCRHPAT